MPLAVTHVATTVFLSDRLKSKLDFAKYEGKYWLFITAVGALLPDIDIFLGRILKLFGYTLRHGSYTHTLFFALLFFALAAFFMVLKIIDISFIRCFWDSGCLSIFFLIILLAAEPKRA